MTRRKRVTRTQVMTPVQHRARNAVYAIVDGCRAIGVTTVNLTSPGAAVALVALGGTEVRHGDGRSHVRLSLEGIDVTCITRTEMLRKVHDLRERGQEVAIDTSLSLMGVAGLR